MVFRQGRSNHGVVLVRVAGLSQKSKSDIVGPAIKEHAFRTHKGIHCNHPEGHTYPQKSNTLIKLPMKEPLFSKDE
jgi:biotin synthase-related radical SAM superfamily protein